jgi:hypothetical protein
VIHGGKLFSRLKRTKPGDFKRRREALAGGAPQVAAPTFGTTGLASHGGRLIYSTTETYEIGEGGVERLFGPHPVTRRVVTAD